MTRTPLKFSAFISFCSSLLTPARVRAQAIVLALCLWGVCVVDFATPGLFDRVGNIKFQDFLPVYVSARLIRKHRAAELYDQPTISAEVQTIVRDPTRVRLPYLYGPQVGLFFLPLSAIPFPAASKIWAALIVLLYLACVYAVWKACPNLRPHFATVAIAALAFPPLFHAFVRGQTSALVLAAFVVAFFALRADRPWLAGILLGALIFKPQFLVALPLIFLASAAWKLLSGLFLSAAAQLLAARLYFGPLVLHNYFAMLLHPARWIDSAELSLAPIQMHSLRSFWLLLIPFPAPAFALYVFSSLAVIAISAAIWKSALSLPLRFSALVLCAVLVNPHLFVHDLLVLAPVLLLLVDDAVSHPRAQSSAWLQILLWLAFVLPLFGPLSRWTHLQPSVILFVLLLATIDRRRFPRPALASNESAVV